MSGVTESMTIPPVELDIAHSLNAILPSFGPTETAALHLLALAGLAFVVEPNFVSFKGGRIRVFGSFVTDLQAALGVICLIGVVAFHDTWIEMLYGVMILNGQGALGILVAEVPLIILSKTHRRMNVFWGGLLVCGLGLVYLSLV